MRKFEIEYPPVFWSDYQTRVFGDHLEDQERLIYSLREYAEHHPRCKRSLKLAAKLMTCVRSPMVAANAEETDCIIAEERCKSRTCLRCGRIRSLQLMAKALTALEHCEDPRFIALTLKSRKEPLRAQLTRLTRCFAKLRRSKVWKSHVVGGLYVIEVTWNQRLQAWHPHLHAVVDGEYFPQPLLKAAWKLATGDSDVVHIARTKRASTLARYLAKYVAKGTDATELPRLRLAEFAVAIHGLRLMQSFGTLHGVKMTAADDDPWPFTERIAFLDEMKRRALLPQSAINSLIDRLITRTAKFLRRKERGEDPEFLAEGQDLLIRFKQAITPRRDLRPAPQQQQFCLDFTTIHAPPIYSAQRTGGI